MIFAGLKMDWLQKYLVTLTTIAFGFVSAWILAEAKEFSSRRSKNARRYSRKEMTAVLLKMAVEKTLPSDEEPLITLTHARADYQMSPNDKFSNRTEDRLLSSTAPHQRNNTSPNAPLPALNFLKFLGKDPQTMAADDLSWAAVNWLRHLANQVHGSLAEDQLTQKHSFQEGSLSRASTIETPSAESTKEGTRLSAEAPIFVPSFISQTRLTPDAPEFVPSGGL